MHGEVQVVEHVARSFAALLTDRNPASIALSGGDTARQCYELLATTDLDWSEVDIWFGDERWVPIHDPDSNEGMARITFLDAALPRSIQSMYHPERSIDEAAAAYDAELRSAPPLDLMHLGLGADGHTASLFPGTPSLDETECWVVASRDPRHPHERLTMTFPAIARARLAVVTVAGFEKREAFARLQDGADLPAARIRADEVVWLVDNEALGKA